MALREDYPSSLKMKGYNYPIAILGKIGEGFSYKNIRLWILGKWEV